MRFLQLLAMSSLALLMSCNAFGHTCDVHGESLVVLVAPRFTPVTPRGAVLTQANLNGIEDAVNARIVDSIGRPGRFTVDSVSGETVDGRPVWTGVVRLHLPGGLVTLGKLTCGARNPERNDIGTDPFPRDIADQIVRMYNPFEVENRIASRDSLRIDSSHLEFAWTPHAIGASLYLNSLFAALSSYNPAVYARVMLAFESGVRKILALERSRGGYMGRMSSNITVRAEERLAILRAELVPLAENRDGAFKPGDLLHVEGIIAALIRPVTNSSQS